MSNPEMRQIVLEAVPGNRRDEAVRFLANCFSLPTAKAAGIVAASPIVILSGLEAPCALTVLKELGSSLPEGVALRIDDDGDGDDGGLSHLQWPRTPRILGRDLSEYAKPSPEQEIRCPLCGGGIRVTRHGGSLQAEPAPAGVSNPGRTESGEPPSPDKPGPETGGGLTSLRSLQAGDSGFWRVDGLERTLPDAIRAGRDDPAFGGVSRPLSGSAAFMKPGAFTVAIGRTREPQAIKMVAEILGIGQERARERCLDLGLPVARGISLEEAQALKARFGGLGVKARIAKPS